MREDLEQIMDGVLHLFAETGTEGAYWAFQDNRFISKVSGSVFPNSTVWDLNNPERKGKVRDEIEVFLDGKWLPLPDPMWADSDFRISSLYCGEEFGNYEADKRLMEKYGFNIKYSADRLDENYGKENWHLDEQGIPILSDGTQLYLGGTPHTEPHRPYGIPLDGLTKATVEWEDGKIEKARLSTTLLVTNWDYKGLHILDDGDKLSIYHPKTNEGVWSGTIELQHYPVFTEHAEGLWIHADQKGMDRLSWARFFFEEYPARLQPAR